MPCPMRVARGCAVSVGASIVCAQVAASAIDMSSPSSFWRAVQFPPEPQADVFNDEPDAGHANMDLIGNATYPVMYTSYYAGDPSSAADDVLSFRLRLGSPKANNAGYVFVGIDATGDQIPDIAVGTDLKPSGTNYYGVPGGETTNIVVNTWFTPMSTPTTWTHNPANFNYSTVASIDTRPTDLDEDGASDYFVSFSTPMPDLISALANEGVTLTTETLLHYDAFTTLMRSGADQDLVGYGPIDYKALWSDIASDQQTVVGAVPEPGTIAASVIACALVGLRRPNTSGREKTGPRWVVSR